METKRVKLEKKWFSRSIVLILIVFSFNNIYAQFNTEIGYSVSYLEAEKVNSIFENYNSSHSMLSDMKPLHYISGFNAGATYRFNGLKFGAFWESQSTKKIAIEGTLNNKNATEEKLYFNFNAVSLGTELQFRYLGIGATFDYNFGSIKTVKNGTSSKVKLVKNEYWSNKVYLIFYFRLTDRFGIALKPYYRLPWESVNLSPLDSYLNDGIDKITQKNIQFGVSFNIINGRQPDF